MGMPLEWYVVRVLLFEEAGFLFPVCIPWAGALVIAALAVGCATLAGLWPACQAMYIAEAINPPGPGAAVRPVSGRKTPPNRLQAPALSN
jgi:hypothetical protein